MHASTLHATYDLMVYFISNKFIQCYRNIIPTSSAVLNNVHDKTIPFFSYLPHMFFLLFTVIACNQLSLNLTQYVVITKEQKTSYDFQDNVELSCKPGFTGKSMTRQCTDVNVWSSNIPVCTSKFVILS